MHDITSVALVNIPRRGHRVAARSFASSACSSACARTGGIVDVARAHAGGPSGIGCFAIVVA